MLGVMNGRRDDIEADPLWDLVGLVGDVDLPKNLDRSEPSIDEVVYEWPSSTLALDHHAHPAADGHREGP